LRVTTRGERPIMRRLIVAPAAVAVAIVAVGTLAAQGTAGATQGAATPQGTPAPATIAAQKGEILQKVIVKVNGEIFTQTEMVFRQVQTIQDQNQNRQIKPEDLDTDPGLRAILAAITPGILVDAVDELIVVQHGKEQGYKFSEQQFSRSLEDLKKANNLDDKTFLEALKQQGITLAELRVNMERAWFINTVRQREIMRNMTLTEEEARALARDVGAGQLLRGGIVAAGERCHRFVRFERLERRSVTEQSIRKCEGEVRFADPLGTRQQPGVTEMIGATRVLELRERGLKPWQELRAQCL